MHAQIKSATKIGGITAVAIILFTATPAFAQITFTGGVYNQNFDSLPTTSLAAGTTTPFSNNSTLLGLFASVTSSGVVSTPANIVVGRGTQTNGGIYSFGATSSTERALGSQGSGGADPARFALVFENTSSTTITDVFIQYTGEQWRGSTAANTLVFSSAVVANTVDITATLNNNAVFTNNTALNFARPAGNDTVALDGNAAANRQQIGAVLSNLDFGPNEFLFVRFTDANDSGNDAGLAIDDFTLSTPEPGTLALLPLGGLAFLAVRRRRASKN